MTVYQPLIPTGTVNLDVDYLNIQGNFQQANVVYGTDHYPFDNATSDQGFHNQVTTPPYVASPPTGLPPATAANPILYSFQQYPALGVLQYSRGPSNAVPSAITNLNSSSTGINLIAGATTNVLDFTGFSFAICVLYAVNAVVAPNFTNVTQPIYWSNNAFNTFSSGALIATNSGNILQVKNNSPGTFTNVFWTLQIIRVQ